MVLTCPFFFQQLHCLDEVSIWTSPHTNSIDFIKAKKLRVPFVAIVVCNVAEIVFLNFYFGVVVDRSFVLDVKGQAHVPKQSQG